MAAGSSSGNGRADEGVTERVAMPAAQRLSRLFRGLTRAYGVYELEPSRKEGSGKKKIAGKARTVRGKLTDELWEQHLRGEQGLGVVPITDDALSYFGAIDIDRYDLSIDEVERNCAALNLPLLPTLTKSGGIHLYVFGAEALPSKMLRLRLAEWATALGFGGVEIFPKQDALHSGSDLGNWINMPYFAALTAEGTKRYGVLEGKPLALEEFCRRAEAGNISAARVV